MVHELKLAAYRALNGMDYLLSKPLLALGEKQGSLINLFFHSLFEDRAEAQCGKVHPAEAITVAQFREAILYFLEHGYEIVSPDQIAEGLNPRGKYLHLTFDDGYFNNSRALPALKELGGSATVFVSADHSRLNRSIWSDVVFRCGTKRGWGLGQIDQYCARLNIHKTSLIEKQIEQDFPEATFEPLGDLDRMFAPHELQEMAKTGKFFFENHTLYHAVLQEYSDEEIASEFNGAQTYLGKITGRKPIAIAYPNGVWSDRVIRLARDAGLKLGFVCDRRKEYIRTVQQHPMTLGRFAPDGRVPLRPQLEKFRSDLMLYERLKRKRVK